MDFEKDLLSEKTVSTERLYEGKILTLEKSEVTLSNGKNAFREIIRHNGGSAVLCEKDGKILLVKQFRTPYNEIVLEVPAGKIEKNEEPIEAAYRELMEEGGIKAGKLTEICAAYPSPGYSDEIVHIFKAEDLSAAKADLDEDEFLSSEWVDKQVLEKMLSRGEIKDAKTIIALLYALK